VHDEVVRAVEALAFKALNQRLRRAVCSGDRNAAVAVLAGQQAAGRVQRQAVTMARRLSVDAHLAVRRDGMDAISLENQCPS
jgi:hypothetical protein